MRSYDVSYPERRMGTGRPYGSKGSSVSEAGSVTRMPRVLALLCALTALSLFCLPLSAQTISAGEATAIAATAAKALDVPFGDGATAKLTERSRGRPEWEVQFHSFSIFYVSVDGQITGILDFSAARELEQAKPTDPPIPQERAVPIATRALEALGMPEDLIFKEAALVCHANDIPEWEVTWQRVYNGIPYHFTVDARVNMIAATGKILSVRCPAAPPPPTSTRVNVSQDQAAAIACQFAESGGLLPAEPKVSAQLMIAQPNGYWVESLPRDPRYDDPYRVVWAVKISHKDETGCSHYTCYCVDPADGRIIGGMVSGGGAIGQPAPVTSASSLPILPISIGSGIAVVLIAVAATALLRARRASGR